MAELTLEQKRALARARARARAAQSGPAGEIAAPGNLPPGPGGQSMRPQSGFLPHANSAIANFFGGPVDIANWAASPVTKALGVYSEDPIGGSGSFRQGMKAIGSGVAPEGQEPTTVAGHIGKNVGLGASMIIPVGATAQALQKGGPVAAGVGKAVLDPFINNFLKASGTELAASAGGGYAGSLAEDWALKHGHDPYLARGLGEIGGGGAASLTGPAAVRAGKAAWNIGGYVPLFGLPINVINATVRKGRASILPFTKGGAWVRASKRLRDVSGRPEQDAAMIDQPTVGKLSPAQSTGNERLIELERNILDTDNVLDDKFKQISGENAKTWREAIRAIPGKDADEFDAVDFIESRREYVRGLIQLRINQALDLANQKAASLASIERPETASAIVRDELEAALDVAKTQEGEFWAMVPERVRVPTANAKAAYAEVLQMGKPSLKHIPDDARKFLGPAQDSNQAFEDNVSAKDMYSLYSELRATARAARSRPGMEQQARISSILAEAVLRDLDSVTDVSEPLRVARTFTREMSEAFDQGMVGKLLGWQRSGGPDVPTGATLDVAMNRPGVGAGIGVGDMRRALTYGDPGDSEFAMRDFIRGRFTDFASPRGEFRPERAADFLRQNKQLLDRFPDLKAEITEAARAGRTAMRTQQRGEGAIKAAEKTATGRFIRDPRFETLLRSGNRRKAAADARRLAAQARRDPTGNAMAGLKSSALDYLIGHTDDISLKALQEKLAEPRVRDVVKQVLDNGDLSRLRSLMKEMDADKMFRSRRRAPGDVIDDTPAAWIRRIGQVFAARTGGKVGSGGGLGGSLQTANIFTKMMDNALSHLTADKARQLLIDAATDPDLYRSLLLNPSMPASDKRFKPLVSWLTASGALTADTAVEGIRENN